MSDIKLKEIERLARLNFDNVLDEAIELEGTINSALLNIENIGLDNIGNIFKDMNLKINNSSLRNIITISIFSKYGDNIDKDIINNSMFTKVLTVDETCRLQLNLYPDYIMGSKEYRVKETLIPKLKEDINISTESINSITDISKTISISRTILDTDTLYCVIEYRRKKYILSFKLFIGS